MDMRYEQYCLADKIFYDSPSRAQPSDECYETGRSIPEGWRLHHQETWTVLVPANSRMPLQGWKIHVSVTLDNARETLDAVWDYCVPREISFKFLTDRISLLMRNIKYAERSGSGKFITIYPADTKELEDTLTELGATLDGLPGPYIL